ncbi:hypothetical protein FHX44_116289 [Pseudonocardia hierapolitana]|uniref:Uncharacterized protein n=1 Tax=Pseudonocardia hierapolitana TaxID=1128676 RepID=A0A561SZP6_9PSEU|nr:hypothetical protein FHX44_116289 [Pseudonocardia hierapolitana]
MALHGDGTHVVTLDKTIRTMCETRAWRVAPPLRPLTVRLVPAVTGSDGRGEGPAV